MKIRNVLKSDMGWLRLVGSLKRQVSFAKEPYKRDYILQKRLIILESLLIVATPYQTLFHMTIVILRDREKKYLPKTIDKNMERRKKFEIWIGWKQSSNTEKHTATHRITLQHTATYCNTLNSLQNPAPLQHTAIHCNTLQYTATHGNTLQYTAPLQHTATDDSFVIRLKWRRFSRSIACTIQWKLEICQRKKRARSFAPF